jgi:hypothetical protein
MRGLVAFGQFNVGGYHIVEAVGIFAFIAYEMDMMIVVVAFGAFVLAKRIADRIVGGGYGMYDAFIHKGLQGAVHGNAVKFLARLFFNIAVGECAGLLIKQLQDFFPAAGHAQAVSFQQVIYLFVYLYGCFYSHV